ncbi:ABC transporter ATP-binding protein [Antarctobacter heliothermus]|uniref:Putative ABC transport system ATP-binding protein n=1 Tax=Antarctobacter heliothermus TaxID=74033 RepID=A0A239CWQ1_9RHOB|nr:ATP-binding cassette domain-containing protein [Antarctobacter heliothermus]SNS24198.1 putative ABC transport system ATP-binding protein [Antarctobacter heliothermus]
MSLPLHITDLSVVAGARTLLRVPSLSLPAGSLIGVRGPSGAGKSTLLYALSGLLAVKGTVRWGETDLAQLSAERRTAFRATHMGLIFQDYQLFEELSPRANACLAALFLKPGDRAQIEARAADWLDRLGVAQGSRSVASFSGGERQRVAVSRALATDPAILLADEPTASLDRPAADRLIEDLVALVRGSGKTLIAVSHDLHLLDRLDRVLTIQDGQLTDDTPVSAA